MLKSTFRKLVRGISAERELSLWEKGIVSWDEFESSLPKQGVLFGHLTDNSPFIEARNALKNCDFQYFASKLDRKDFYRVALEAPDRTLFLDIETTGLSRYYDNITIVGWSYQGVYKVWIQGDETDHLFSDLSDAQVIVTFNGSMFDLPFLEQEFSNLRIPPIHLDLRFLAKRVGLTGGQKAIESQIGFKRLGAGGEVDGEGATIMWHRYRRGDLNALKLLIRYNAFDIEGMKKILDTTLKRILIKDRIPENISKNIYTFSIPSKFSFAEKVCDADLENGIIYLQPYRGDAGPKIHLSELLNMVEKTDPSIVGIDLTGSGSRPSGFCHMHGGHVNTCCLGEDEEIIAETVKVNPDVISIDSPLSLPKGRVTVFDDDPGRKKYGIMRFSERLLKKRGVNVYPALIPSMQKLTLRGMTLAKAFRKLGYTVIESYPGAAQDIMGIPRKRASIEMLKEGLAEFGVSGNFTHEPITHDELDAITSSIVGIFFMAGKYESLGESSDEALIIPKIDMS